MDFLYADGFVSIWMNCPIVMNDCWESADGEEHYESCDLHPPLDNAKYFWNISAQSFPFWPANFNKRDLIDWNLMTQQGSHFVVAREYSGMDYVWRGKQLPKESLLK